MAFHLPVPMPPYHPGWVPFLPPPLPVPPKCSCTVCSTPSTHASEKPEPNPLIESSPFRTHLGTNYSPNAEELGHIRTLVAEQQADIDTTTAEITRLQEEIARLNRQNKPKLDFIRQHTALLTPLRQIPVEILQEIFFHCLHPHSAGSLHKDDAPMSLTRVCRDWRQVALQCPRLWSTVYVAVPAELSGDTPFLERRLVAVRERLERTGSLPLDITIYQELPSPFIYDYDGSSGREEAAQNAMEKMLQVLRPYVPRWRKMVLTIPFASFQLFVEILSTEMEALEECCFNINMPPGSWGRLLELSRCTALRSSKLKKISLLNLPSGENLSVLPISWGNLTHLVFEGNFHFSDATPYLRIMDLARDSLQSFRCKVSVLNSPFPMVNPDPTLPRYDDTVIHLPHLKELIVQETNSPVSMIGKVIRCPVLEVLEYHEGVEPPTAVPNPPIPAVLPNLHNATNTATASLGINGTTPTVPDGSLSAILSHSGTFIKHLTLNPHIYTLEQVLQYLSWTPQVETLKMIRLFSRPGPVRPMQHASNARILESFFKPNTSQVQHGVGSDSVLCPRLRVLIWGRSSSFAQKMVLDFLSVKQGGGLEGVAKMEKIAIHLADGGPSMGEFYKEATKLVTGQGAVYATSEQVPMTQLIRAGMYGSLNFGGNFGGTSWPSDYSGVI